MKKKKEKGFWESEFEEFANERNGIRMAIRLMIWAWFTFPLWVIIQIFNLLGKLFFNKKKKNQKTQKENDKDDNQTPQNPPKLYTGAI